LGVHDNLMSFIDGGDSVVTLYSAFASRHFRTFIDMDVLYASNAGAIACHYR